MTIVYTPVGQRRDDPGRVGVVLCDESLAWIAEHATRYVRTLQGDAPERVNPSVWLPVEDQQAQGACRGHSGSSVYELAFYWATGLHLQFSRQHMYIAAQRESNIRGDQGATIAGGFQVMFDGRGLLPEKHWPYTGQYVTTPPGGWAAADQISSNYHAEQLVDIPDFEAAVDFLGQQAGAIDSGFMWSSLLDEQAARTGIIERFAPGSGGHAVCFVGYERVNWQGREVLSLRMVNSWSQRWGRNGTVLWLPDAFNAMRRHRWTEIGGVRGVRLGPQAELPAWKPSLSEEV